MGSVVPLRVAILINHPPHTIFWPEVKQAFVEAFSIISPEAKLDLFDPIVRGEYPDPEQYDLIILSGGKGNACGRDSWVLQQIDFVKELVEKYPAKKLVGICLGHQLLTRALDGIARDIPSGPIAGLVEVKLTEEGRKFFPRLAKKGSYSASQFHVREVEFPPPEFIQLAENNEAILSESNTIISFQAHPEIDGIFARKILDDDDPTYVERLTQGQIAHLKEHCADPQDGLEILTRVVEWVHE